MAQKQSIFGRISQLTRANINALIDRAEDPQKMLDQMVRDYTSSIAEAKEAVAQTIGNLRMLEADHAEDVRDAEDWGRKAIAASTKADELRNTGDSAGANKFDNLAKIAIGKQMQHENEARGAEPMIAQQNQNVEKLKEGLQMMNVKLDELRAKRDELVARQKTVKAQATVQGAIQSINVLDPTTEISRFEEQVRREEARVAGHAELNSSSLDDQFRELEDYGKTAEIEARLAALKSGNSSSRPQLSAQYDEPEAVYDDGGDTEVEAPLEDKQDRVEY